MKLYLLQLLSKNLRLAAFGTCLFGTMAKASECNIGQTMFVDTLYGMGGGALVGGLWSLANIKETKSSDVVPTLATGALIGGGLGIFIGTLEVVFCTRKLNAESASGTGIVKPVLMVADNNNLGYGFKLSYNFQ